MKLRIRILFVLHVLALFSYVQAQAKSKHEFNPYGRVKATALVSDGLLNSFSFVNSSAPTSAGTDLGFDTSDMPVNSFQVAQSRIGTDIIFEEDVYANLEFDFIDFAVSSPTTEARPRLRRAFVGYRINEYSTIQAGQDWDTFSPLTPNMLDYVGLQFGAGNTGFMRQQFKWRYTDAKLISEVSLGMAGKNPSPAVSDLEEKSSPALAYRLSYDDIGFSAYYSNINKSDSGRKDVTGLNVFLKQNISKSILLTAEVYQGQNMNEAALLGLSKITGDISVREFGGYLNLTYLSPKYGDWNLNIGFSKIENPEDITAYNYDSALKRITEDGIVFNTVSRLYWNKKIKEDLSFVTELSHYSTDRKIAIGDTRTTDSLSLELGMLLVF